jgi:hypothetical protein
MKQHWLKRFFVHIHGVEENKSKTVGDRMVGDISSSLKMKRVGTTGLQSEHISFHGEVEDFLGVKRLNGHRHEVCESSGRPASFYPMVRVAIGLCAKKTRRNCDLLTDLGPDRRLN